jgi:hypothetical protein
MVNTRRHRPPKSARLRIVPLTYRQACATPTCGWRRRSRPGQPTGTGHADRVRWEIAACGGRRAR